MLRDGPEVLSNYKWIFISQRATHGCQHAHDIGNRARIVLYQATNGVHWDIDHMIEVPKHDQMELVEF